MNWLIIALIVGLVVIAGVIAVASFTGYATADKVVSGGCKSCNGQCTAGSNCGSASCGAVTGGTCTCGK